MAVPEDDRRRSLLSDRRKTHVVIAACCVALSVSIAVALLRWFVGSDTSIWPLVLGSAALVVAAAVCAASGFVRFQRVALGVGTDLVAATIAMALVLLVPVALLGRRPNSGERSLVLAFAPTTVIVTMGFLRIRRRVDRSLIGGRDRAPGDPYAGLRMFTTRLTRSLSLDELLLQLCETVGPTMSALRSEVSSAANGVFEIAASVPHRNGSPFAVDERSLDVASRTTTAGTQWLEVWAPGLIGPTSHGPQCVAPLVRDGKVLGFLLVERPAGSDPLDDQDQEVLVEVARSVALALHNAQLDSYLSRTLVELSEQADQLRASRARLVAPDDDERRRIERDLHDGATAIGRACGEPSHRPPTGTDTTRPVRRECFWRGSPRPVSA